MVRLAGESRRHWIAEEKSNYRSLWNQPRNLFGKNRNLRVVVWQVALTLNEKGREDAGMSRGGDQETKRGRKESKTRDLIKMH